MLSTFIDQNIIIFAAINDGKRRRIQTSNLKKQLLIVGAVFALGLGTMLFAAIPATVPAATTFLETTIASYLPGMTTGDLALGIGGVVTRFGPGLIEMIKNSIFMR